MGLENQMKFRFGNIVNVYYEILGEKMPKQLDLLDAWFPGLIITTDVSDGLTKREADYNDLDCTIHAVKYHGRFYSGGSTRVSQIIGRLVGTASGNQEKERKNAELIQKHIAECFASDMTLTPRLKENTVQLFKRFSAEQEAAMQNRLQQLIDELSVDRESLDTDERNAEAFPMDDETFDGTILNAEYQLNLATHSGLCNAYLWLLTGSLLRNEIGRVLWMYDSAFIAIRRQHSETGELTDKLNYLCHPEEYEYTFDGDEKDLENRFPDVEWYCDKCGAHLNEQTGFDDHLPEWKCRVCGYENKLDISEIYDSDEDWKNRIRPVDAGKFADALERRRKELEEKKK
ncbi:MAG: hypothetical protein ACOYA9_08175 [Bilifractor sp.]|jgi:hypothetical protein